MDQGGSSVRHPKGARSIGIGHRFADDRCTETRSYPLDPLRVAEQKSSFSATRKGSRSNAYAYTSVAVQSRRLIPPLMLPPTDPAGAKPRRDHRFLDRVSRHVVPKTPGMKTSVKIYDPARASHLPVSQSVRHPGGVAGLLVLPCPRVFGATPLDPGLKSGHPCRGASFSTIHNDLNGPLHHSNASPLPPAFHVRLVRSKMVNFVL